MPKRAWWQEVRAARRRALPVPRALVTGTAGDGGLVAQPPLLVGSARFRAVTLLVLLMLTVATLLGSAYGMYVIVRMHTAAVA